MSTAGVSCSSHVSNILYPQCTLVLNWQLFKTLFASNFIKISFTVFYLEGFPFFLKMRELLVYFGLSFLKRYYEFNLLQSEDIDLLISRDYRDNQEYRDYGKTMEDVRISLMKNTLQLGKPNYLSQEYWDYKEIADKLVKNCTHW